MFDDFLQEADLSRFCSPASTPRPELTEDELQQLEQRADDWYISMM